MRRSVSRRSPTAGSNSAVQRCRSGLRAEGRGRFRRGGPAAQGQDGSQVDVDDDDDEGLCDGHSLCRMRRRMHLVGRRLSTPTVVPAEGRCALFLRSCDCDTIVDGGGGGGNRRGYSCMCCCVGTDRHHRAPIYLPVYRGCRYCCGGDYLAVTDCLQNFDGSPGAADEESLCGARSRTLRCTSPVMDSGG
ncbi:hypothetical protein AAVH_04746 [Aphelenchoides avenae]|nr:hypothetical protein AAVH_04746 [Aphelenchus avenae]